MSDIPDLLVRRWKHALLLGALVVAEVVGGVVLHQLTTLHGIKGFALYISGCAILVHYVHLLAHHYRPVPRNLRTVINHLHTVPDDDAARIDWRSVGQSLDALIAARGDFPHVIISEWRKVSERIGSDPQNCERLLRWLQVLALFAKRGVTLPSIDHITELLRRVTVPRQVEAIFRQSLAEEVRRMNELAQEQPIPRVDRDRQYTYASGVAQYYAAKPRDEQPTVYATALDTPSAFYRDFEKYFKSQTELSPADQNHYLIYAEKELRNLERLLEHIAGHQDVVPELHATAPSEKARVVVIEKARLIEDFAQADFWNFIKWHIVNHVGLKFFLRDAATSRDAFRSYEDELCKRTGQAPHETIDDYIVYGDECVFGRIDSHPDADGRVTLGFYYANGHERHSSSAPVIVKYRKFFETLWSDDRARTLTGLWWLADFKGVLGGAGAELASLGEQYKKSLMLKPVGDRSGG